VFSPSDAKKLQTQFAVGAEAHQFETFSVGLAVDQDEVRADVAIPVVLPFSGKRVIDLARRERRIDHQKLKGFPKQIVEFLAEDAGFFTPIVPFESAGVFNRPH
jgi:hypothetical protein